MIFSNAISRIIISFWFAFHRNLFPRFQLKQACIGLDNVAAPHYIDVIMSAMASQITNLPIIQAQIKANIKATRHWPLCAQGIHPWPMTSPHRGPVTWKMFPFDDVIMERAICHYLNRWQPRLLTHAIIGSPWSTNTEQDALLAINLNTEKISECQIKYISDLIRKLFEKGTTETVISASCVDWRDKTTTWLSGCVTKVCV